MAVAYGSAAPVQCGTRRAGAGGSLRAGVQARHRGREARRPGGGRWARRWAAAEAAAAATSKGAEYMEKLAAARGRQYVLVGGKGGVGKTSTSSSMGLALAQSNHNTLIVSTDPAHSLSDSLAVDVSGGRPVRVAGVDDPLWAMEVDAAAAKARFQDAIKAAGETGSALRKTLSNLGLSGLADALDDLDVGALLETPPPGFDEFLAIAEVIKLLEDKDK